jgi:hypothetical protein
VNAEGFAKAEDRLKWEAFFAGFRKVDLDDGAFKRWNFETRAGGELRLFRTVKSDNIL